MIKERVIEYIKKNQDSKRDVFSLRIARDLKINVSRTNRLIQEMEQIGLIRREQKGRLKKIYLK